MAIASSIRIGCSRPDPVSGNSVGYRRELGPIRTTRCPAHLAMVGPRNRLGHHHGVGCSIGNVGERMGQVKLNKAYIGLLNPGLSLGLSLQLSAVEFAPGSTIVPLGLKQPT